MPLGEYAEVDRITPSQLNLLRRIAKALTGLDVSLISGHDPKLGADLAELQQRGVIETTTGRASSWMNPRQLTAMVTDLGRALLRAQPGPPQS